MMSGILKRKFEEVDGPSSFLSLRGSDGEVSASDSGNSSDSVSPTPSAPLAASPAPRREKRSRGRGVSFEGVTVYYFGRRQGFTSVPTQGGSTLGMSTRHCGVQRFTLGQFALEQERSHRVMLRDHLRVERLSAIKLKLTKNGTVASHEAESLTADDIPEEELDLDNAEVDDYFFLQPLTTRRRRALLRASGVRRIDAGEKRELRAIRASREECGCACRGRCHPETCACSLAGIQCQVDRMSFPCSCSQDGCGNTSGRVEFNPVRVRTHFLHTIMKLQLEKSGEQLLPPPPPHAANGYRGDVVPAHGRLTDAAAAQAPVVRSQAAADADGEEEEEDEEEDDDDDDDDDDDEEDYEDEEDEEDGSSLCSGLSDCSTHSLETSDEEEEEEEEEEDEDNWECSDDGWSVPPVPQTEPLPLRPAPGFSDHALPGSHYRGPSDPTQAPSLPDTGETAEGAGEQPETQASQPPHTDDRRQTEGQEGYRHGNRSAEPPAGAASFSGPQEGGGGGPGHDQRHARNLPTENPHPELSLAVGTGENDKEGSFNGVTEVSSLPYQKGCAGLTGGIF